MPRESDARPTAGTSSYRVLGPPTTISCMPAAGGGRNRATAQTMLGAQSGRLLPRRGGISRTPRPTRSQELGTLTTGLGRGTRPSSIDLGGGSYLSEVITWARPCKRRMGEPSFAPVIGAREPSRKAGTSGRLACPGLPNAVPRVGEPPTSPLRITLPRPLHLPPDHPSPTGRDIPSRMPGSRPSGCRESPAPAYTAPPVRCPPSLVVHCNEPPQDHTEIVGQPRWILYRGNAQCPLSILPHSAQGTEAWLGRRPGLCIPEVSDPERWEKWESLRGEHLLGEGSRGPRAGLAGAGKLG